MHHITVATTLKQCGGFIISEQTIYGAVLFFLGFRCGGRKGVGGGRGGVCVCKCAFLHTQLLKLVLSNY